MIIGLCGKAGSGKSSVSKFLQGRYGAKPASFAAPLKRICMDVWGFSEEQVFGEADVKEAADESTGIVPRWAMKKLGQATRDHLGAYIWIEHAFRQLGGDGLYVFEDVRYVNEANAIDFEGGHVLRLHCSDSVSTDDGTHPSEAEVDLIPAELVHEIHSSRAQGLEHLFAEVKGAMDELSL